MSTRNLIATHESRHRESVQALKFSADSKKLGAADQHDATVWDLETGQEVASFKRQYTNYRLKAFSNDLGVLALPDYQEIDLIDMKTGKASATLSEHQGEVGFLAYSDDGKTLLAASLRHLRLSDPWLGDLKLWDVSTGKERVSFPAPIGRILKAALSPDGKFVAALDSPKLPADPLLKLLDVATGKQTIIKCPSRHAFISLAFAGDNKLFVIGTPDDKTLRLWEVALPKAENR